MSLQLPRVFTPPLRDLDDESASWGYDFAWFCSEILGDPLSDWQEWLGIHALEVLTKDKALEFALMEDDPAAEVAKVERLYAPPVVRGGRPIPNGRLRFTKIVILIARQNGKTDFVKKLIKWAIFRKRLKDVLAAAQTLNKAIDLWNEILDEVEKHPKLSRQLGRVDHSKGAQAMWTKGKRNRYRPVGIDENAGRGDTIDLLYIDELRTQKGYAGVNSLSSTITVPDNGLLVTTSNAGSDHSVVLREYRELAAKPIVDGTWQDTRQGLFEWSADPAYDIDDERGWRQANPDLSNGRITISFLRAERESSPEATFRTERLCQWVAELGEDFVPVIDYDRWDVLAVDRPVNVSEHKLLAVEVSPDSERYSLVAAGQTRRGVHLVTAGALGEFNVPDAVDAIKRFVEANGAAAVVMDQDSPASVLIPALQRERIDPWLLSGGKVSAAWKNFRAAVGDGRVTHDGAGEWSRALRVARERDAGKKFPALERYSGDISTLIAGTFAVWALDTYIAEFEAGGRKAVDEKPSNPLGTFPQFTRHRKIGGVLVV